MEQKGGSGHSHRATELLQAWGAGDAAAFELLIPLVHAELRRLARRYMGHERPGHTLQPTALVNEAYLRLVDLQKMRWQDRAHFLAMAARLCGASWSTTRARRAIASGVAARGRSRSTKRWSSPTRAATTSSPWTTRSKQFAAISPRKAEVVELRFFGGLSVEETAEALHVSPETVKRDWRFAKAWLVRQLAALQS